VIEVRAVSKTFGKKVAVKQLTFDVSPGHVTGFLGPNGAGKSTTMRMMLDLDRPTSGQVLINGSRYCQLREPLREVGALLDAQAMHPGRSGRKHLVAEAHAGGLPVRRVEQVLDMVGLTDAAGRRIKGYSLGMRQRLGIASALLGDPGILIFDEPVNGLDVDGVQWIRSLLRRLADEGRSVLVSSHLMSELEIIADRVVIIGKGELLADAGLEDFIASVGARRVEVRTDDANGLFQLLSNDGLAAAKVSHDTVTVEGIDAETVGARAHHAGIRVMRLAEIEDSLEHAYLKLTNSAVEHRGMTGQEGR